MSSARLTPLLRRSAIITRASTSALRGGASPPLPPFARIPVPSQSLVEQHDAVFDDGVAPELALDFDCQHISSWEGFGMWLGGLAGFATIFLMVKASDPASKNPALNRKLNMVVEGPKTRMELLAEEKESSEEE